MIYSRFVKGSIKSCCVINFIGYNRDSLADIVLSSEPCTQDINSHVCLKFSGLF